MQWAMQPPGVAPGEILLQYFSILLRRFGPQRWWPARTRLEIIVGAILTQNTTWHNAALALRKLRKAGRLSWKGLHRSSRREVEACVKPAGFYRQKARAVRNFVVWLARTHGGSLNALFALPPAEVRRQLLEVKGLGPETADTILLYAGRQAFFVADAYTRRVLARHGLLPITANYAHAQSYLHKHLPADQRMYNEFHALLVEVGKKHCQRDAAYCERCPLEEFLPSGGALRALEGQGKSQQKRPPLNPLLKEEGTKLWSLAEL